MVTPLTQQPADFACCVAMIHNQLNCSLADGTGMLLLCQHAFVITPQKPIRNVVLREILRRWVSTALLRSKPTMRALIPSVLMLAIAFAADIATLCALVLFFVSLAFARMGGIPPLTVSRMVRRPFYKVFVRHLPVIRPDRPHDVLGWVLHAILARRGLHFAHMDHHHVILIPGN